ncbi:hypothetical protein OH77DRAFT_593239 [Trametes cingulata]|nr:hypothetical protein OH77DRAFT_593239 [Trametes cingulata]
MASFIFAHISLGGTLGVIFIGSSVSSMLYGLTCLQTMTYFRSKKAKTDSRGLHLLVAMLLLFDSAHQAIVIHICYNYLVLGVKDPFRLAILVWSVPIEVFLNGILAIMLNSFLTLRLWRLSNHNILLTALAGALSLANLGTNISYGVRGYQYKDLFEAEAMLRPHGIAGLSISVANELMISTSLAYYLYSRRTGLRRSKNIVNRLIALTVTTGMLTTIFDVVDLIAYTTARDNLYVLFFNFLLAKLYANALLTSLNGREYILGIDGDSKAPGQEAIMLTPHSADSSRPANVRLASHGVHVAVDQFIVSETDRDTVAKFGRWM